MQIKSFIESKNFVNVITALILINAITLGMETDPGIMARYGDTLHMIDRIILMFFVVELALKLTVYRLNFFKGGWNWFDFIIVGISLIPASGSLAIFRTLRVLRVLRLLSVVPSMRRVISALLRAIPGMASIMSVLMIIYYVAAVFATQVFGKADSPELQEMFGTIGDSMFTLFQLMTLENWHDGIAVPTMAVFPFAWIFFVVFIVVTSFAVLNLFIGVIVDAMNIIHAEEDSSGDKKDPLQQEISELRAEIAGLRKDLMKQ